MSGRRIKAERRRRRQPVDSGKLYSGDTWKYLLRTVGPGLSLHLMEMVQQGHKVEDLAIVAGDGKVLQHLMRGWPAAVPLSAAVVELSRLRRIAERLGDLLPPDMQEQLAAPPNAGSVHVLLVEADRIDILTQAVKHIDLKPFRSPVLDPETIDTEDMIRLARLEAARFGFSVDEAELREVCTEHKAALLAAGVRLGHGAAGPAGAA